MTESDLYYIGILRKHVSDQLISNENKMMLIDNKDSASYKQLEEHARTCRGELEALNKLMGKAGLL